MKTEMKTEKKTEMNNTTKIQGIKRFAIKNKRDWVIFWVFAALVAYVIGGRYNLDVNEWLRGMETPWLTNLNEPQNYGKMIVALILLAVLAEVVLFLCRKPMRMKLAALAVGLILPLAVVGIYQLQCRLIVSVLWDETPFHIDVRKDGNFTTWKAGEENLVPEEQWREVLEFCRNLTVVTDEQELEKSMEWYESDDVDAFMGEDYYVSLKFPRKYGHEFSFSLRIKDGYVYLWRGYKGRETMITFFEDNGIVEWMDSLP